MKNSIKIALAVGLFVNIASANPIGRVVDKVVRQFTIKHISTLNQNGQGLTSNPFAKSKKYAESLLLDIWHPAVKKGIIPSRQEFAELDNSFGSANHGILNVRGEGGHTILYHALHLLESPASRKFIKGLKDRCAALSERDRFVMGPEKELKAFLNVPLKASARTTIKVYRTFLTKNTEEKLLRRFNAFKMTGLQKQERLEKVEQVKSVYSKVEKDLLAQRATEKMTERFDKIV